MDHSYLHLGLIRELVTSSQRKTWWLTPLVMLLLLLLLVDFAVDVVVLVDGSDVCSLLVKSEKAKSD